MTKVVDTTTESIVPTLDLSTLSIKELSDMLATARKAEKAKEDETKSLPMFAFAMITTDSPTPVYWSGRAVDDAAARVLAMTHAGPNVFVDALGIAAIMPRPIPAPRGRKVKAVET